MKNGDVKIIEAIIYLLNKVQKVQVSDTRKV